MIQSLQEPESFLPAANDILVFQNILHKKISFVSTFHNLLEISLYFLSSCYALGTVPENEITAKDIINLTLKELVH